MEWKQLKITASEKQKAQHLQAVEKALVGRRFGRRVEWAMPLTVLFTAIVLCFLIMAPGLSLQDKKNSDMGQAAEAVESYEKGYVYRSDFDELGKPPSTIFMYGVKKFSSEQMAQFNQLIEKGTVVEAMADLDEPFYELGLTRAEEKVYVRVYNSYAHDDFIFHFVEENRWLGVSRADFGDIVRGDIGWFKIIGLFILAALIFWNMSYVDRKYIKDKETGRRKKQYRNLWHPMLTTTGYIAGIFYLLYAHGALIYIAFMIAMSGQLIVFFLDRGTEEFAYRKYFYFSQLLYILFFLTMFATIKTI